MCILTNWFCSLIDLVFELTDMVTVVKFRQTDIANKCFDYCFNYYEIKRDQEPIDILAKCFTERPGEAFRKRDSDKYVFNACGSYLAFLGLDFQEPQFIAIGDQRYQNCEYNYQFSIINSSASAQPSLATTEREFGSQGMLHNGSVIHLENILNYSELYSDSEFDPAYQSTDALTPYVQTKQYVNYETAGKTRCKNCVKLCTNTKETAFF